MNALLANGYIKLMNAGNTAIMGDAKDIGDKVGNKFYDVIDQIKAFATPAAICALSICAIYLLFGSDPSWIKKAKSWAISIFIGLLILYLAPDIITAITEIAQ